MEEGTAPFRDPEALKRLNYGVHAWVFCRSIPEGAPALMHVLPEQVPCPPLGPGPMAEDTGGEGHTGQVVAERKGGAAEERVDAGLFNPPSATWEPSELSQERAPSPLTPGWGPKVVT